MKRLVAGLAGLLLLTACAPTPGDPGPTEAPATSESVTAVPSATEQGSATESESAGTAPSATVEASPTSEASEEPASSPSPSESPVTVSPTAEPPAEAPASGWAIVDRKVSTESEADAAGLPSAVTQYVKSRLAEPCNVQFNLFAVHPDGYLVADESGICAGAALFVYGPDGSGRVSELVESTSVQPCSAFRNADVPTGVPKTKLLPDGLVCSDGGAKNY